MEKNHWEHLEQIWHLTVEKKKDEAFLIYSYLDKHFSQNSDYFCLFTHTTLCWGGKCLSLNRNIILSWIMCVQVYKRGVHNVSVVESNTLWSIATERKITGEAVSLGLLYDRLHLRWFASREWCPESQQGLIPPYGGIKAIGFPRIP